MLRSWSLRLACLLVSAGLHALVLALVWGTSLAPPLPIEVVLVAPPRAADESPAPRATTPGAPAPRPAPPPQPVAPKPVAPPPVPAPAREVASWVRERPRLLPPLRLDLPDLSPSEPADGGVAGSVTVRDSSAYGPGDARLTLLLRADRIRGSRYEADARRALAAFPDHRLLAGGAGLDPLGELDSILIATADPADLTATFLAARYSFPEGRLRQGLERGAARAGRPLVWRTRHGRSVAPVAAVSPAGRRRDPRVLVLARPGVAVLTRPEHVDAIAAAAPPDGGTPAAGTGDAGAPDWDGRLSLLEAETGGDPDGPALLLALHDVRSFVVAAPGELLPIPHTARLMVTALRTAPTAWLELGFDDAPQAARFAQLWPPRARQLSRSTVLFLMGLSGLARRIQVRAQDDAVQAHVVLLPAELQQILRLVAQVGPVPPSAASSQPASRPASRPASLPASRPAPSDRRRGARPAAP